jgi:ABC-type transport system substrate-binding protein
MKTQVDSKLNVRQTLLQRRQTLAMFAGSAAIGLVGMPAWAQEAKKKGGILKVAALTNPSSLDPATGGAGTDHVFLWTLFDTLVEWDYATLRTKPGLADWSFPDPKTMLLTIKPGINFHDGTPCDAQAVKFNLDRNRQDARSNLKADLASITAVDVVGALQVKLTLKAPDVVLPAVLSDRAGMMVSPKAVKELGNDHDRKPVGAGPWKFVRWEDNQRVVVTRNENYWKSGEPYADGIEISVITDQATALRSVTAGQNDMVYALSARYKPLIERARNITLVTAPTLYCIQIYFNFGRARLTISRFVKPSTAQLTVMHSSMQAWVASAKWPPCNCPHRIGLMRNHWQTCTSSTQSVHVNCYRSRV